MLPEANGEPVSTWARKLAQFFGALVNADIPGTQVVPEIKHPSANWTLGFFLYGQQGLGTSYPWKPKPRGK
jgi:hypothetical protein